MTTTPIGSVRDASCLWYRRLGKRKAHVYGLSRSVCAEEASQSSGLSRIARLAQDKAAHFSHHAMAESMFVT